MDHANMYYSGGCLGLCVGNICYLHLRSVLPMCRSLLLYSPSTVYLCRSCSWCKYIWIFCWICFWIIFSDVWRWNSSWIPTPYHISLVWWWMGPTISIQDTYVSNKLIHNYVCIMDCTLFFRTEIHWPRSGV